MSKHTPGPWVISGPYIGDDSKHNLVVAMFANSSPIGVRWVGGQNDEVTTANARLLSAAPELLDALETLAQMDVKGHQLQDRLQFTDEGRVILKKVRDAISKARGDV